MKHLFLIGMLCGVMITAAVTYVFAIPANSDYWRMEIWKRGGAAWTYDNKGHLGWKWMVHPVPDTRAQSELSVRHLQPTCASRGCRSGAGGDNKRRLFYGAAL